MDTTLGVGEAKKRFSELMSRTAYRGERFIIERHGKPMAALVSPDDLARLEAATPAAGATFEPSPGTPGGVLAAAGAWGDDEELDRLIADIYSQSNSPLDRPVDLK